MFNSFKRAKIFNRLIEERLYETVLLEVESGDIRVGLWSKALAQSDGDEKKAKAKYIVYRVESLRDEAELVRQIEGEINQTAKGDVHYSNDTAKKPNSENNSLSSEYLPYSFRYGIMTVKHDNKTFKVNGRYFTSAEAAKHYIDTW